MCISRFRSPSATPGIFRIMIGNSSRTCLRILGIFPTLWWMPARKYVTINGNSVGECIEATGSVWSTALLYEKDKKDPSIQYFVMYVALEGTDRTRNDVTIEIKKGLISRENKKFEPL